jgi:hypothetical protein
MKPSSIPYPSASKGDFREPPHLSKSKLSSGCELHRSLKAMVQAQPFSSYDNEDPFDHLREFEKMCLLTVDKCQFRDKRAMHNFSVIWKV